VFIGGNIFEDTIRRCPELQISDLQASLLEDFTRTTCFKILAKF
jgi:hypothetical protein